MYRITNKKTGERRDTADLAIVEALLNVDATEIAWALEEYGKCETDEFVVREWAKRLVK